MNGVEIAGGTVAGRDHVRVGKNSQDAYYWEESDDVLVAVVCDGCGSSPHSEVGAKLGAKLVVRQTLLAYLQDPKAFVSADETGFERLKRTLLISLSSTIKDMAGSFSENVRDYFLFTILGVIVDQTHGVQLFGCGDGVYYWNGFPVHLSAPNNTPAYLSYGLIKTEMGEPELKRLLAYPGWKLQHLLLGTDGVSDLEKSHDLAIPGKEEKIGSMSQFWEKDGFFKNPFSIGHRLALINRSVRSVDWEKKALIEAHGPLRDDTTLIAIRSKK